VITNDSKNTLTTRHLSFCSGSGARENIKEIVFLTAANLRWMFVLVDI